MNPRVEVRRAAESDAEGIAHVHVQAWHEAYSHLLSEETLASLREGPRADQWRGTLRAGRTDVWVAVDGEVIVGWAAASAGRDDDAPWPLELEGIYVLASHHGSGTGQSLLHASIDQRHAYLWMAADNPRAHAFYRRNGFRHDGATKTVTLAGEAVDVIRLSR